MEKLSDLPLKEDAELTPQESDVMQKYFNTPGTATKTSKSGWMDTIKLSFYAAFLFVVLANPWIDSILCMVPYCGENALILLAFKTIIFMILFVVMLKVLVN